MCVAIDWKPENGCDIQSACCGESGIVTQLKLVKTAKDQTREEMDKDSTYNNSNCKEASLNEGNKVIKDLCLPWANTDCVVLADLHFAL